MVNPYSGGSPHRSCLDSSRPRHTTTAQYFISTARLPREPLRPDQALAYRHIAEHPRAQGCQTHSTTPHVSTGDLGETLTADQDNGDSGERREEEDMRRVTNVSLSGYCRSAWLQSSERAAVQRNGSEIAADTAVMVSPTEVAEEVTPDAGHQLVEMRRESGGRFWS